MPPRPWLTNALKRSQEWHDRLARSNAISLRHGSKPQVQCKTFFCGTASAQTQMSKYAKRKVSKEAALRRPVPVVDRRIFCQVYQAGAALYGPAAGKGRPQEQRRKAALGSLTDRDGPDLKAVRLGRMHLMFFASQKYLETYGGPWCRNRRIPDLCQH